MTFTTALQESLQLLGGSLIPEQLPPPPHPPTPTCRCLMNWMETTLLPYWLANTWATALQPFVELHAACSRGEDEATSRPAVGEEERATNMQLAHSGDKLCSLSHPPCLELYRAVQPRKADQCDSMCHTVLALGKRFQAQHAPSGVLFHLNRSRRRNFLDFLSASFSPLLYSWQVPM